MQRKVREALPAAAAKGGIRKPGKKTARTHKGPRFDSARLAEIEGYASTPPFLNPCASRIEQKLTWANLAMWKVTRPEALRRKRTAWLMARRLRKTTSTTTMMH